MPADVVTGQDLDDVAAYVGTYAGVPGAAPPEGRPAAPAPRSSPTTAAAAATRSPPPNSGGVTGPNLDEVLPGQSAAMIEESIVDPNAKIAKGYPANVMPENFGQTISPKEIEQLVEYLIESTSGGRSRKAGG